MGTAFHDNHRAAFLAANDDFDQDEQPEDETGCPRPWDIVAGYEHEVEDVPDGVIFEGGRSAWTRHQGHIHHRHRQRCMLITLRADQFEDEHEAYRRNGCSKQTAAEMVAAEKRRRIAKLVEWYKNGWTRGDLADLATASAPANRLTMDCWK